MHHPFWLNERTQLLTYRYFIGRLLAEQKAVLPPNSLVHLIDLSPNIMQWRYTGCVAPCTQDRCCLARDLDAQQLDAELKVKVFVEADEISLFTELLFYDLPHRLHARQLPFTSRYPTMPSRPQIPSIEQESLIGREILNRIAAMRVR
ncbi:hypothetical protein JCM8547_003019 [Rhodosporidiobolus lusitaniae]